MPAKGGRSFSLVPSGTDQPTCEAEAARSRTKISSRSRKKQAQTQSNASASARISGWATCNGEACSAAVRPMAARVGPSTYTLSLAR